MLTRTNTLCSVVIDCEPGVTRRALRGTVHRAIRASLTHAVLACARNHYPVTKHINISVNFLSRAHEELNTRTHALCAVVADCPPSIARRAFWGTTNRTLRAGTTHAVVAYADIHCGIARRKSVHY